MFAAAAFAAAPVHIVKTDLKPLIRAAGESPVQFAVLVPHAVSTGSGGTWSSANAQATWRYAVQVPTAVSLSFHATKSFLPPSARLVVRGSRTVRTYQARDMHLGDLWSGVTPGEALEFTLTVADADRSRAMLNIVSLQAGYRSLGAGVKDHPYYRQLKAQASATGNAACVVNYECQVTTANTPLGAATVGLLVENLYQCTGVLINDVPGDNTPFVLTARHCETGQLGGGNPGAASAVTVYWNATTPCGSALGSLYDGADVQTQTGAQTVVEQQDAWLIRLGSSPVATNAQFAGFDSSGAAIQGGYTIHHAEGYDKQFTEWFGHAAAVQASGELGVSYISNFWETVNQLGNVGPGASGSGLIDQNNHLIGSLSLGRTTTDPSGYGACPVANPPAPNGSNGVADFTALSAIWASTADTTSSTGSVTLKSVLDPGNTGTQVVQSQPAAVLTFQGATGYLQFNQAAQLTWNAANATQCTAGGGIAGDGWSGTLPNTGTQDVTETTAGAVTYTLTCTYPGGRTANASVQVEWVGPAPTVQFTPSSYVAWTGSPVILSWTANVAPCAISGGNLSLSNLPASGNTSVTQSVAGDVLYTLTCGPANDSGSFSNLVQWETPNLMLRANGTDRLLGQAFTLGWDAAPNTVCTPSGGAPNDGWSNTEMSGSGEAYPQVTTLGTYTYTLLCAAGPVSQQQSVTVTFEDNAPYVTASLNTTSVTFSDSPADYVTLTYNSNLTQCTLITTPNIPLTNNGSLQGPPGPQAVVALAPAESGTYQLSLKCYGPPNYNVTSTPLSLTVSPPPPPTETITFTPGNTVVVQEPFSISWSSTNAPSCNETGNIPGQNQWGPQFQNQPPSGQVNVFSSAAGQYTIGLTCQSIDPNTASTSTSVTLNVVNLTATLTATPTSVVNGGSFTLAWTSSGGNSCVASGGGANGSPWSGTLGASGSLTQTATTAGTFTYAIACSLNDEMANAQAAVTVTSSSGSSGGSSGGHGGGGGIGWLELGSLVGLLLALARTRPLRGARTQIQHQNDELPRATLGT
jgi:hypothetical protein